MCLIFVIAEFIAGYFANSVAVKADAAHMLVDLLSFGVGVEYNFSTVNSLKIHETRLIFLFAFLNSSALISE